jgi:hypothetical protein
MHEYKADWDDILRKIATAEDNASRAFMWGYAPLVVFPGLDAIYDKLIASLTEGARATLIEDWFAEVTRPQNLCIDLYDPFPTSGRVYSLNRFLVKLLMKVSGGRKDGVRVIRKVGTRPVVHSGIALIDRRGLLPLPDATLRSDEMLRRVAFKGLQNQYGAIA